MTKTEKLKSISKMSVEDLMMSIAIGHEVLDAMPADIKTQIPPEHLASMNDDLTMLKTELLVKGVESILETHEDHTHMTFKKVDLKVKSELSMVIPSVNDLINGLTAPDLMKSERH